MTHSVQCMEMAKHSSFSQDPALLVELSIVTWFHVVRGSVLSGIRGPSSPARRKARPERSTISNAAFLKKAPVTLTASQEARFPLVPISPR